MVQQDPATVLRMELVLLKGLEFDLIVHSPLRPLDGFFQDLAAARDGAAARGEYSHQACLSGTSRRRTDCIHSLKLVVHVLQWQAVGSLLLVDACSEARGCSLVPTRMIECRIGESPFEDLLNPWQPFGASGGTTATAAADLDAAQSRANGSAAGPDARRQTVALGPYAAQRWESEDGSAAALDGSLRSLTDEQLARAQAAAGAAADSLMLTDAPLMFPPGQLALAAMRAAFRKVPLPSLHPAAFPALRFVLCNVLRTETCT